MKILLVQLRQVGDCLLAGPLVRALKQAYPDSELDYLVETYSAEAARGIPGVDEVIPIERKLSIQETIALAQEISHRRYDLALDVQSNQKTGLYTWFTQAPVRIGFHQPWYKLHTRVFYSQMVPRLEGRVYTVRYRMQLLEALGIESEDYRLEYRVDPKKAEAAQEAFRSFGSGGSWIGLAPGGRVALKSWPYPHYLKLGKTAIEAGHRVLVMCGPGEEEIADQLVQDLGPSAQREPRHDFGHHAAWLSCLAGAVVQDGGNTHLLAGLDVPAVHLFGPTDPEVWGVPEDPRQPWMRSPCHCNPVEVHSCSPKPCLVQTRPEAVWAALQEAMDAPARGKISV